MDTELVKKLQESANAFLKGIENLALLEKSLKNQTESLEQRKAGILKETAFLEEKRIKLYSQVENEHKIRLDEIENNLKEAKSKNEELTRQLAINKTKENELTLALRDAANSKSHFDSRAKEYDAIVAEMKEKKAKLQAVLS